jgi:hypothetical protein
LNKSNLTKTNDVARGSMFYVSLKPFLFLKTIRAYEAVSDQL